MANILYLTQNKLTAYDKQNLCLDNKKEYSKFVLLAFLILYRRTYKNL